MRFLWATATHVGMVRGGNEDSVYPTDPGQSDESLLAAVADGMGGHVGGEVASRTALEAAVATDGTPAHRLRAANDAVVAAITDDPALTGMGTTLTLGIFDGSGTLDLGHIGDSRGYLYRGGELTQLTSDHTLVAELIASGRIRPEDAATHPQRHLVTRAIGIAGAIDVDEESIALEAGDRVLLCSDGLTTMVNDDDVATILGRTPTPDDAAWALVEAANAAGGHDNVTVVVVDVLE